MAQVPVVLLHGFASSAEHKLAPVGLDRPAGRGRAARCCRWTCRGHGGAGQPTEPAAYADVPGQVAEADRGRGGRCANRSTRVGFSAGAETLLAVAAADPGRFRRLAVLGIGSPVLDAAGDGTEELARAAGG